MLLSWSASGRVVITVVPAVICGLVTWACVSVSNPSFTGTSLARANDGPPAGAPGLAAGGAPPPGGAGSGATVYTAAPAGPCTTAVSGTTIARGWNALRTLTATSIPP